MKLLQKESLQKIIENYSQGEPIYNTVAGCGSETISNEKRQKQISMVSMLLNSAPNGWFREKSPAASFRDKKDEFCHIISSDFDLKKVAHRLYFNIGDSDMEFAAEFLSRCRYLHKIPHYLKFDKLYERNDGFVIYVDDEHLEETIAIIEQLGKESPHYKVNHGMPLATYDCGWYSYGKELKTNSQTSFNGNVANVVEIAIGQLVSEMGYEDVIEHTRISKDEVCAEVVEEALIKAINEIMTKLQDENFASQFYSDLRERIENSLHRKGLLLTDKTVPKCISELNKDHGMAD